MKINLTFKTPDVIYYATQGLTQDEAAEVTKACEKWVKNDEYINVEIDTVTGTCTPKPVH